MRARTDNYHGLTYIIWTSKLISGTNGNCVQRVQPYEETISPATILSDFDGYFHFKTLIIFILFQSLKGNNSKSIININHLSMDFPYVVAELTYCTHDDSFHRIVTESDSFNFIACHGNAILSSEFIVKWGKPFDKTVWLLLFATIAILTLISGLVLYAIKTTPFFKAFELIFESIIFALVFQYPKKIVNLLRIKSACIIIHFLDRFF